MNLPLPRSTRLQSAGITFRIAVLGLLLLAASCGSDTAGSPEETTTTPTTSAPTTTSDPTASLEPTDIIFERIETGGCQMAGPNCARTVVYADGSVENYRTGEAEPAATGNVDANLVERWLQVTGETDLAELKDRLGPGELTAAFDGVDYEILAPHADITISSVDFEFATGEPFFDIASELGTEAYKSAQFEIVFR